MTKVFLSAVMPDTFKTFLKPLKKTAVKGKQYDANDRLQITKIVSLIFYNGVLFVCTPTECQSASVVKTYEINTPIYFSVLLTDLVGSYKYPGLLDVIRNDRLDLYKTDEFFIIKQGRDTFRMAVL